MSTNRWFDVDKEGFAKLVAEQKAQAMVEVAFSNPLDQNVKLVAIDLVPEDQTKGTWLFRVTDDDPDGFSDLAHAYTVFAESGKKTDATKRGRFNLGEKLLLSLCIEAKITSTKGTVRFQADGKRVTTQHAREAGTEVRAIIALTDAEVVEFERLARMVLLPKGVKVEYNGQPLQRREVIQKVPAKGLDTVIGEELRASKRNTTVELVEVLPGERAYLYELGIPVVVIDLPYHANVMQKVPLNFNRDNVSPAYKTRVHTLVLDAIHVELDTETANATWVKDALPTASADAVRTVVEKRFGDKAVAFDPSDLEANKVAASQGYTVVGGRTFGKDEWAAVRNAGVLPKAGSVTPSNAKVELTFAENPKNQVPDDKWTDGQRRVIEYAHLVAKALLGKDIRVTLYNDANLNALAFYGNSHLGLNLGRLGKAWFESPDERKVDALLLHEYAHDICGDHLDHDYHEAICNLGAELKLHPNLHL